MGEFRDDVAGKTVALVGPASTLSGTGMGRVIDAYDIVVRLNHAWPLPPALQADTGARIDILYHNLLPTNQRIRRDDVLKMRRDGVRWVVCTHAPDKPKYRLRHRRFRAVNRGLLGFRTVPGPLKRALRKRVGSPNSGLVAIVDLLRYPIKQLYITGFSFYTTRYLSYPNYQAISHKRAIRHHDQRKHRIYVARLLARDNRITLDPFLEHLFADVKRKR